MVSPFSLRRPTGMIQFNAKTMPNNIWHDFCIELNHASGHGAGSFSWHTILNDPDSFIHLQLNQ